MSEEAKLPTPLEEELARHANTAAALERVTGGAISFRAGIIAWQGQPVPGNRLPCVVVDSKFENRWYTKPFDADNPSNPDCFAIADTEAELAPHPDSINPQGGPGGKCEGCPKSMWKSDPRGGRGKACGEIRRLALIPVNALESAEAISKAEVAIAKTPVTSTRYWGAYVNRLNMTTKRPPFAVVTEIYTEPHPKHQFHVHFNAVRNVPNELIGPMMEKLKLVQPILMAGYTKSETAPQSEQPQSGPKKF